MKLSNRIGKYEVDCKIQRYLDKGVIDLLKSDTGFKVEGHTNIGTLMP